MSNDPTLRPRDHFTPRRGWLNDPNGLIHHDGEFHLFFQHHPHALVHGPISWGHAVSADLVDWTELPTALLATDEEHVWSGSVVHDASHDRLVAAYTAFDPATGRQAQSLAFSTDRGRTWVPHPGNPVLDVGSTSFRDPKVFRHGDGWAMVVVRADDRTVDLYRSPDLLAWTHHSIFGPEGSVEGVWECPDVVTVPVESTGDTADVLLVSVSAGAPAGGSGMQYFVGELTEAGFRSTQPARWLDHGPDCYAAVSYTDAPGEEPVIQGWMSNWLYADTVPATDFRGSMTVARRLTLRRRGSDLVLVQRPVVRPGEVRCSLEEVDVAGERPLPVVARSCRVVADLEAGTAQRFGLHLRVGDGERTTVAVDPDALTVSVDRTAAGEATHPAFAALHAAPLPDADVVRLEVVVDMTSVEVFVGGGEVVLTEQVFPDPASTGISVFAEGGTARIHTLSVVE
ncbi:glycoside hydrolase family 32 protein [Nocardioides sp.]|uniref:glycoside hydrolase family 32 protein n=1 Tax=Nocardioides sp. TaxID=35761 RepID=UPI0035B172B8